MPRGSRIVDIEGMVHDVARFVMGYNGEAKEVGNAWVAADGVVCQFWPPTTELGNAIIMTTDTEVSYAAAPVGTEPRAVCNFDARTGSLILSNGADGATRSVQILGPPPRGMGKFLWKLDVVSGAVVADDPTGSWVDVLSEGTLGVKSYYLPNDTGVLSVVTGEVTVSIAEDDGFGAPEAGTEVSKTVNLTAEIVGPNITMTTVPWVLSEVKVNETAYALVVVLPTGIIRGYEGSTISEQETYALTWHEGITVQVDVISGSVIGDTTGSPISTDEIRGWQVEAPNLGDDNNAEIDVTIADGTGSVTKRVTLHAQQIEEAATSSVSTDFTQFDQIRDFYDFETTYPLFEDTWVRITFNPDGTVDATNAHNDPVLDNFPQIWNVVSPNVTDPENFEIMCEYVSGNMGILSGDAQGVFLNMSTQRSWYIEMFESQVDFLQLNVQGVNVLISVQEVGRPSTREVKTLQMRVEVDANFWPGPGAPP